VHNFGYCMGFIENILRNQSNDVIIVGNFHVECVMSRPNSCYKKCVEMFDNYCTVNCDDLCDAPHKVIH
jgi:hypothetical protein